MQKPTQEFIFITELLNEKEKLSDFSEAAHELASLRDIILKLELKQEIQILRTMLQASNDLSSFQPKFKQRCLERLQDTARNISFKDMPESYSNCLYWEIALKVFKPQTMKEMLAILLDEGLIHLHVEIALPANLSLNKKDRHKHPEPMLRLNKNLDAFAKAPPALEAFTHYVIADNFILNITDIEDFRLYWHDKLKKLLDEQHPKVSMKLYSHNDSLQMLVNDILVLNNKGITPKIAIEQLIQAFILGGEHISGSKFASKGAEKARERFLIYFYGLPADLQKQLRSLKADNCELGRIIDEELERGQCVETAASNLKRILDKNSTHVLLNTPPAMTEDDLAKLQAQYDATQGNLLNCKKDSLIQFTFPAELTKQAIQEIVLNDIESLVFLLLNFPPTFYDTLWEHVRLNLNGKLISNIFMLGFFSGEQRRALANAYVKHYRRFNDPDTILLWALEWAIQTNDIMFVYKVFLSLPKEQKLPALKKTEGNYTVLDQLAVEDINTLIAILDHLPDHTLQLLQEKQRCLLGRSLADYLAQVNIDSLILIIDHFPDCRLQLFQEVVNYFTEQAFIDVCSLTTILNHFPDHKLQLLQMKNDSGKMVIHAVIESGFGLICLIPIINSLSEKEQIILLKSEFSRRCFDCTEIILPNPFLNDLLVIYNLLISIRDANYNTPFFATNKEALELMATITKSDSFDAVKKLIIQYVTDSPNSLISR